jgi:2-iminobutanoate/2-iminopropanoate deaminase
VSRRRVPARGGATYSDALVVDLPGARIVYLAGQTPHEPVPEGLRAQTEACFRQIEELLREQGASLADVVQITSYLTDLSGFAEFSEVRAQVFGEERPTSTAVGVADLLGGVLVEITAVAVVEF